MDFVRDTTETGGAKFVPAEERIATFDQDGTLWVEHPMYTQVLYCLERVPELAKKKPYLKKTEPFATVLSGNPKAIAKLSLRDLEKILAATLTGMSVDEFKAEVKKWLATSKHPRYGRLYTELVYQPMQEVLQYLRASGYKTYIVAVVRTSCANTRSRPTASRRNKSSGPRGAPSMATIRTASHS
jgi:FMN phosphatase YigB (HAD superfamily)